MKRPFACIGFGALAALAAAAAFPLCDIAAAAVCFILSAALFILYRLKGKNTLSAALFVLCAAAALSYHSAAVKLFKDGIVSELDGQTVEFSGVIVSEPYTSGQTTLFTVKTAQINGEPRNVNLSVAARSVPRFGEYALIQGRAELHALSDEDDLGLGYATYKQARHIFLETYISPYNKTYYSTEENPDPPVWKIFYDIRHAVSSVFKRYLPHDEASLCTAMITGDKNILDSKLRSCFNTLGTAHILVVSGLHLSVTAALLFIVSQRLGLSVFSAGVFQLAGIFAFALMTGFGFSVRRAALMFAVIIVSRFLGSAADPLNTLGAAAGVLSLDPFCAGDVGLLWSFSCTLALTLFADKIACRITGKRADEDKPLWAELLSAAVSAMIGSLPFVIFVTKVFSPYTLAANLLTVPVTGIVIICGGLGAALTVLGAKPIGLVMLYLAGMTAKYLIFVTKQLEALPFSGVWADRPAVRLWFVISAAVLLAVYIFRRESRSLRLSVCVLSASCICAIVGGNILMSAETVTLQCEPISGGMTIVLTDGTSSSLLFCGGDKYQASHAENIVPQYGELLLLTDLPAYGAEYDYMGRLVRDADVPIVVTTEKLKSRYAWYEYCGGDVRTISESGTIDVGNCTLEMYCSDNISCEYLTIGDSTVLIASGEGEIPKRFCSPDKAVLSDITHINGLDGACEVHVILEKGEKIKFRR